MALLPAATENAMVEAGLVPGTTYYMSLHSATPGTTGASEVSGGSYARQAIIFGSASGGILASTDAQSFTSLPALSGGVPYLGIWTASSGGTFMGGGTVSGAPGPMSAGASLSFGIGVVTGAVS